MRRLILSLKKLKQTYPWLWDTIEYINGMLVNLMYGRVFIKSIQDTLETIDSSYTFRALSVLYAALLVDFIHNQPKGFDFFSSLISLIYEFSKES